MSERLLERWLTDGGVCSGLTCSILLLMAVAEEVDCIGTNGCFIIQTNM